MENIVCQMAAILSLPQCVNNVLKFSDTWQLCQNIPEELGQFADLLKVIQSALIHRNDLDLTINPYHPTYKEFNAETAKQMKSVQWTSLL